KLRVLEQMGVTSPVDVGSIQLTDSFAVEVPTWKLDQLLTMAEQQNPALKALRAREGAASWGVRAATASYGPALSVSAGWSGFTQQFTDVDPIRRSDQAAPVQDRTAGIDNNTIPPKAGVPPSVDGKTLSEASSN